MRTTFVALFVVLSLSSCAGGTIGTGIRKVLQKPSPTPSEAESQNPKSEVGRRLPQPSNLNHTTVCFFESPTSDRTVAEIQIYPDRVARDIHKESFECSAWIYPEQDLVLFEVIRGEDRSETLRYQLSERPDFGSWEIIRSDRIPQFYAESDSDSIEAERLSIEEKNDALKSIGRSSNPTSGQSLEIRANLFHVPARYFVRGREYRLEIISERSNRVVRTVWLSIDG